MSFENENIDRLFSSLEDYSMPVELDQFDDMEIRLEKMRYFRFGWKHFNIYYTVIIILSFLFSIYALFETLSRPSAENKVVAMSTNTERPTLAPAVQPAPAVVQEKKIIYYITKEVKSSVPDSSHAQVADVTPQLLPQQSPAPVKDTTPVPVVTPAPKVKKVVVIQKRDTIVKYDTTKVIKRK